MSAQGQRSEAGSALPLLLAALWPLGVYTQVPLTPFLLAHLAALALGVAALVRWRANRRHRPPFEYWWPVAALLLAALGTPSPAGEGIAAYGIHAVFFLGALILVQGQRAAAQACLALACAGATAAILNGAAQAGFQPPTLIAIEHNIATSGPPDLRQGALLVFHAALGGLFASVHPLLTVRARATAAVAAAIALLWLARVILPVAAAVGTAGATWNHLTKSPAHGLMALLALWLLARVAARGFWRQGGPDSPPRGLAPALVLAGAAACILWGAAPDPTGLLLLGLLAAHDNPWSTKAGAWRPTRLLVPALSCVAIQVLGVLPLAATDPRNQAARASRLLEKADWVEVDGVLDFMLARHPGHPAYTLLRARSLAAQGWPEAAAEAFCSTAYPEDDPGSFGISLASHQRDLLDALRDQASRLPAGSRGLFFERALVHTGDSDNALRFLAIQETAGDDSAGDVDAPAAARALALLLGNPELEPRLVAEDPATLRGYLAAATVQVDRRSEGLSDEGAPLLLHAIAGPDGISIDLWRTLDEDQPQRHWIPFAPPAPNQQPEAELRWAVLPAGTGSAWKLALQWHPHTLATVTPGETGEQRIQPAPPIPAPAAGTGAAALFMP